MITKFGGEVELKIKGNQATATADVTANHYLNEMFWQITGSYEYGLVKEDGQWTINQMTFIWDSEALLFIELNNPH